MLPILGDRHYGKRCAHFEYIVFFRNWEINVLPFSLHGFPAPFRRRFPALPFWGHGRVSHADGHAVFKVQRTKRQQKSRHKTDQPCLRFFWKVMLVGYVTAESQDVQPHWGFHCSVPLRKRELLRTRHFRQCAGKNEGNFGKKREDRTVPALLTRKNTRLFMIIKL